MDDGHSYVLILLCGIIAILTGLLVYFVWLYWQAKAEQVTEEDIMSLVYEGHEQGVLETNEAKMITNIFELNDKEATDIMTHRTNVVALDGTMLLKDAARFILREGSNSRYPVYEKDLDDVIGILYIRDALVHAENPEAARMPLKDVPGLLRKAAFIPETRNIDSLFREMQAQKNHMTIVIDEYGQTIGIVTMEDILEEIVGNILDEYDEDEDFIVQESEDCFLLSGMTPIEEVSEVLQISFVEADLDTYDTINGFLISRLNRILQPGEHPEILYSGWLFQVVSVENKMIHFVRASRQPLPEGAAAE